MSTLSPLQPVGINTDFISDQPLALNIKSSVMGGSDTITFEDGTPFLKIERELLSVSRRMHFIDTRSGSKLFEMRKEKFRSEYFAEHPGGSGANLFVVDIDAAFMGGPTAHVQFPNIANGGTMTEFHYKVHTFDSMNTMTWNGQTVAEVEKASFTRNSSIRIAPFVDPLPVLAMLIAVADRARRKRNQNSSISSGGSSGI